MSRKSPPRRARQAATDALSRIDALDDDRLSDELADGEEQDGLIYDRFASNDDNAPLGAVRAHVGRLGRSLALGICPWRVLHAYIGSYGPRGPAEACVISARSRSEVMTPDRDRAEVIFSNTGVSTQSKQVCACNSHQLGVRSARVCPDSVREAHTATSTVWTRYG